MGLLRIRDFDAVLGWGRPLASDTALPVAFSPQEQYIFMSDRSSKINAARRECGARSTMWTMFHK